MKILMIYEYENKYEHNKTEVYLVDTGDDVEFAKSLMDCHKRYVGFVDEFQGEASERAKACGKLLYETPDEIVVVCTGSLSS